MNTDLLFGRDLLLADLSKQVHPAINTYQAIKKVDLSALNNIDSAGVAYLVQMKIQHPGLLLINASSKLRVLAELYGVENLFEK